MKKSTLNGVPIPYGLPIDELSRMLSSTAMSDFALACEALSYKSEYEAYRLLSQHESDRDKYRRLYVLKTIFRHPSAGASSDFLEASLLSDDSLFVENALTVIAENKIKVTESLLLSVVKKHLPKLYINIRSLSTLDINDKNYNELTTLFKNAKQCVQRELIGEVLIEGYLPSKAKELFELFRRDGFAKIRMYALKIASEHGYNVSEFLADIDGHVRKLAQKSLGALSFLSKYIPLYRVDVSDDLHSAVIYNPSSEEHLYVEYDNSDESWPYTLSFSFQHVHLIDERDAEEWIDEFLNEESFAIEYFMGEERKLGGQISADELKNLSYELLEDDTGYYAMTKLYEVADRFKLRGWSGKNDFDGFFVERDGEIQIIREYKQS